MWILFAFGSAIFAGITAVLSKIGIKDTDSTVATAIRTIVVLIFSWIMAFITGGAAEIESIDGRAWIFLILSGLATGASWLCYFHALGVGEVSKVTAVDKSSTVLTMLLGIIFLNEGLTAIKAAAMVLIGIGTYLMIDKKPSVSKTDSEKTKGSWLIYAAFSAIFAALTSILAKVGMQEINSNLGTAVRTIIVLIMAWVMIPVSGKTDKLKNIPRRSLAFICLSGVATGASWLCYFRALQDGPASVVVPIDKLSILVTIVFARIALKEKLSRRALIGLVMIIAGTFSLLIPA